MRTFRIPKKTKKERFVGALSVWMLAISLLFTNQASAQNGIEIESTATYEFGRQVIFTAQIKGTVQIQQATIVIFDEAQGISHVRPVTFADGRSEFVLDTQSNAIQPFASVRWYYQLTLADGSSVQSGLQSFTYADNRFSWQSLDAGALHVAWAQGDSIFGQHVLNAALSGLESVSDIIPININQPVTFFIYPSQNDISLLNGNTWEIGRAYPEPGIALVVIEPDSNQSVNLERRVPHELMHLMLYRQLGAGYKNLPLWLNEGLATLAEINPTSDYERILQDAGRNNNLIPLHDLCASFPSDSASAFLAYAQARSFTNHLRDKYSAPALLNLAKAYASGMDCENGMQSTLGITLSEAEAKWHETALGQNALGNALRKMLPYIVLLILLIFIPFISGMTSTRQKADKHGSQKFTGDR